MGPKRHKNTQDIDIPEEKHINVFNYFDILTSINYKAVFCKMSLLILYDIK